MGVYVGTLQVGSISINGTEPTKLLTVNYKLENIAVNYTVEITVNNTESLEEQI